MTSNQNQEEEFLQRLRATFKVEAEEHLHAISSQLLELESTGGGDLSQKLEIIFRHIHSLKGAARAVNLSPVERVCQALESLFAKWKAEETTPPPESFDLLHKAADLIAQSIPDSKGLSITPDEARQREMISALEDLLRLEQEPSAEHKTTSFSAAPKFASIGETDRNFSQLDDFQSQMLVEAKHEPPAIAGATGNEATVRVPTAKLDQLLLHAEEMLAVKISSAARSAEVKETKAIFTEWEKEWAATQRSATTLLTPNSHATAEKAQLEKATISDFFHNHLASNDVMQFLEWNAAFVRAIAERLNHLAKGLDRDQRSVATLVDDLLSDSKKLLMLPFSTLGDFIPKLVRDLSREQGKQIELSFEGKELEVDKRILEEMKDPLIHLVRNCIDHGLELPEIRKAHHKNPSGQLTIRATQTDGNTVAITVADDGAGIDLEKVKASAVKGGMILPQDTESMSKQENLMLIFKSQLSTKPIITEISGRGLGLAIVQETVNRLGGRISVDSILHVGTSFHISLPSRFATLSGLLVRAGRHVYVLPAAHVDCVVRLHPSDVEIVQEQDTISINDTVLPFANLGSILMLNGENYSPPIDQNQIPVVIIGAGDDRVAFGVEEVLNVQDVPLKPLKKPLLRVRNIMGATTLESGRVIPILNPVDLVQSVQIARPPNVEIAGAQPITDKPAPKRILVAEDSITSRMLLKGILESAGYQVDTVVDGVEAITTLRINDFDLIVSDIEMPRMNGFDLTAQIRRDRKLAEKPVVLITALSSQEDRERGIDAGADAYIVKSSFDQSDLLNVVKRLI